MLYRSTRNKLDSYTSYKALRLNRSADGGLILPLKMPVLDALAIEQMKQADVLQNIAQVLNLFFGTDLTAWDIESAVGKNPLPMVTCGQKTVLVQCWKNPTSKMDYYVQSVFECLCKEKGMKATIWVRVAIRIAFIVATLLRLPEDEVDIAVNAGNFEQALAAYYCRMMGISIRKILIACNENSNLWDFAYRGCMRCGISLQKTAYPEQDKIIPDLFEGYLFLAYGYEETKRYLEAVANKQDYQLSEDMQVPATDGIFVSVVGQERITAVVSSFYSNNAVSINPYTAFCVGALQDYRAKAGDSTTTVVFEEAAP